MPYVNPSLRTRFRPECPAPTNTGLLNYQITCLIDQYMSANGLSYASINDVLGALRGASGEFQRRVADPYEDKKVQENGDVYSEENLT